jgi:RNA binding exosome subunit
MMEGLIKVGKTSIAEPMLGKAPTYNEISNTEVQEFSQDIRACLKDSSNQNLQKVTDRINERPHLFNFLFPGKIRKEGERLAVEELKNDFRRRQDMLEAVFNFQITMAKKMSEMMIASKMIAWEGKLTEQAMQCQADLTAFSQIKLNEMKDVFDESRVSFGNKLEFLDAECERHRHLEYYYKRAKRNLEYETDIFFDTIEELLSGFKNALNNKLSEYKAS